MEQVIVGVPGPWEGSRGLIEALARTHGTDYLFAAIVLLERGTGKSCTLDLHDANESLREAFEIAGQGQIPEAALAAVEGHRSTAYLVFDAPGYETARTAARFAKALLEAGGFAVKVETAGVAHAKERWTELCGSENPFHTYSLFVTLVGGEGRYYSCGMHNFALPDAAVPESLGPEEGAYTLNLFNLYQLTESPPLADGHTFSTDADAPRFRVRREAYVEGYDPATPLFNPHGLWSLLPA